jgi:hypothetical protein
MPDEQWWVPLVILIVGTGALQLGGSRGVAGLGALPSLVVGKDGRWSTSKTTFVLWTYGVLYMLLSMLVEGTFVKFTHQVTQGAYLVLLGFPVGTAVIAKTFTLSKIASGDLAKPDGTPSVNPLADIVSDDTGRFDLLDFQYFVFNVVALAFVIVEFHHDSTQGLPAVPDTLLVFTLLAAVGYSTKKGLEGSKPSITSMVPSRAAVDAEVVLTVTDTFAPETDPNDAVNAPVAVLFSGASAPIKKRSSSSTVTQLTVTVPHDLTPGQYTVTLVSFVGNEGKQGSDFTVV